MAYGTSAGVLFYLSKNAADPQGFFTAANITLAIADADVHVDQINSSAASDVKTIASNMIAADIMEDRYAKTLTQGAASTSQTAGEPAVTYQKRKIPSTDAIDLLMGSDTVAWAYSTTTSRNANDDYLGPARPTRNT